MPTQDTPNTNSGFSLVEVMGALAIVSISLLVLIRANASAMNVTLEAERMSQATLLGQSIMNRALGVVEIYGFGENDVHDRGNFEDLYPGDYPGWSWEWSLAKTHVTIPDFGGFMDDAGVDENQQNQAAGGAMGTLQAMGGDMIDDMVGKYLREIRVTVCYPTGKTTNDCVTFVSHVVNPGGRVMGEEEQGVLLDRMGSGRLPDIMEEDN